MATLQIRKKSAKVWEHLPSDANPFIISKLYAKTDGGNFKVVEESGSNRKEYSYSDITVYDDTGAGTPETFANAELLMLRLEELSYVGFNRDGDVPNLINEAPLDGQTYGRKDGGWVLVSGGTQSLDDVVTIGSMTEQVIDANGGINMNNGFVSMMGIGTTDRGISCESDHTADVTDFDYVQKKYVDDAIGTAGGAFIPLSGTVTPVTGHLEFDIPADEYKDIYGDQFDKYKALRINNADIQLQTSDNVSGEYGNVQVSHTEVRSIVENTDGASVLSVVPDGLIYDNPRPASKGISGVQDFSANITSLDYPQKIYVDAIRTALLDGVDASGDTLQKLYNMIVSGSAEVVVANTAARNAYNVPHIPFSIFVTDDGDGNWAKYQAITTGVGATFVKLSDPDLLNAAMSNAAIKTAYESNSDTNAYTNADKAKVASTSGTNTGDNATNTQYSGLAASKADLASPALTGTVSIGGAASSSPLTVIDTTGTPIQIEGGSLGSVIAVNTYGGTGASTSGGILARFARGTKASPLDVALGDRLGYHIAGGYAGGAYRNSAGINIMVDATGTVSATSLPTHFAFLTTANGSVTRTERMRICSSGNVLVGSTTDNATDKLQVTGSATFSSTIKANTTVRLKGFTVATLPAGVVGDTAYVTDALTPTFGATVVGGGAVVTPVFYDGTNWTAR